MQNCQWVLGCFSLFPSKVFSATVSGTHCNEQSQEPEATWCYRRRNSKRTDIVNKENSTWAGAFFLVYLQRAWELSVGHFSCVNSALASTIGFGAQSLRSISYLCLFASRLRPLLLDGKKYEYNLVLYQNLFPLMGTYISCILQSFQWRLSPVMTQICDLTAFFGQWTMQKWKHTFNAARSYSQLKRKKMGK